MKVKQNKEKEDLNQKLLQLLIDLYWLFIKHPIQTSDNGKLFKMLESILTDENSQSADVFEESIKIIINYLYKINKELDIRNKNYTPLKQECDRIATLCKKILTSRNNYV